MRVSSDEPRHDQQAPKAFDGESHTLWYTKYAINELPDRPHELVLDLGKARMVVGFIYLPRQLGYSGQFDLITFHLSDDPDNFRKESDLKISFTSDRVPQNATMEKPVRGRFLLVNIHSILNRSSICLFS